MYKMVMALAAAFSAFCGQATRFGHCICDSVSLDGEWEMAYQTNACESVERPVFRGARIANAVPGYWEDMRGAFDAAGLDAGFRGPCLMECERYCNDEMSLAESIGYYRGIMDALDFSK